MKYLLIMMFGLAFVGCNSADPYPVVDDLGGFENGEGLQLGQQQSGGLQQAGQVADQSQQAQQLRQQQLAQQQALQQQTAQPKPTESTNTNGEANMPAKVDIPDVTTMTVETSKGTITIGLLPQQAPETIQNYIDKAGSGFYEGLTWHRVEDWVVQGGDPDGNGTGGGTIPTELTQTPFRRGSVGVARGQDINVSNDAQFFVCKEDCGWLTGKYTIFGQVENGMDVVDEIAIGDEIVNVSID